jgi:hypothetical protein
MLEPQARTELVSISDLRAMAYLEIAGAVMGMLEYPSDSTREAAMRQIIATMDSVNARVSMRAEGRVVATTDIFKPMVHYPYGATHRMGLMALAMHEREFGDELTRYGYTPVIEWYNQHCEGFLGEYIDLKAVERVYRWQHHDGYIISANGNHYTVERRTHVPEKPQPLKGG